MDRSSPAEPSEAASQGATSARPPSRGRLAVLLLGIYLVSLAVRLTFLAQATGHPLMKVPVADERINWALAERILERDLPPDPFARAPGYTHVLAVLRSLLHTSTSVRTAQVFLDALTPVLMFAVAARCFGLWAGVIAGLLGAVYWTCVFFSSQLLGTSLACLLCLTLAFVLLRLPEARLIHWFGVGLLAGVGAVFRPNFLPLIGVLPAFVLLRALARRLGRRPETGEQIAFSRSALRAGLFVLGGAIAIAPVAVRNRVVGGDWVLLCVSGGTNLWIANNPQSDGREAALVVDEVIEPRTDPGSNNPWLTGLTYQIATCYARKYIGQDARLAEVDAYFQGMFTDYVRQHPGKFVKDIVQRFCWLFNAYEFPNNKDLYDFRSVSSLLAVLSHLHFGVVCPLALLGVGMTVARLRSLKADPTYVLVLLGALIATGALFIVNARYRMPVVCLLLPFASFPIVRCAGMLRRPRSSVRPLLGMVVGLTVLAVFCNANLFGYRPERRPLYLDWILLHTCRATGDDERLTQVVQEFGDALVRDVETPRRYPSLMDVVRRYSNPFGFLMTYHDERGNTEQALRFGKLMLQHEGFFAEDIRRAFALFLDAGDGARCLEVLKKMSKHFGDPRELGDYWLRFGQAFSVVPGLIRAAEYYALALRDKPLDASLRRKLADVQASVEALQSTTATSPAATNSRP